MEAELVDLSSLLMTVNILWMRQLLGSGQQGSNRNKRSEQAKLPSPKNEQTHTEVAEKQNL